MYSMLICTMKNAGRPTGGTHHCARLSEFNVNLKKGGLAVKVRTFNARSSSSPAWDAYANRAAKDAAEHDKAIEGHSEETLCAMARDLGARHAHDRRDNEQRWVMGRKAAVLRKLAGLRGAIR